MERLEAGEHFDYHDYREGLKLLKEDRETTRLANRRGYACPACGEEFGKLFVSARRENTFGDPGCRFCVVRTDDQILLLTH